MRPDDLHSLPAGLPVPVADGASRHLRGLPLPRVALPSTRGGAEVFYPVFPPDADAGRVAVRLRGRAA